jgi:hypothetical protein
MIKTGNVSKLVILNPPAGASVSLVKTNKIGNLSKLVILKFTHTTPGIYKTLEVIH